MSKQQQHCKNLDNSQLATAVYIHSLRKQIEKEIESKYSKRIEYLVNANNELMYELEQRELELVTIESELVTVEKDVMEGEYE